MTAWSSSHAAKGSIIRKSLSKGVNSIMMLLMLSLVLNLESFAQTDPYAPTAFPTCSPCNAHRWYSGDGWRYDGTRWQAVTLSSPNLQPKGVVRCASSAETESKLQRFGCSSWNSSSLPPLFNTLIASGPQSNYYDMNGGLNGEGGFNITPCSTPVSPTQFNPPSAGEQMVWLNFDMRPNAGSMQFQVVTNQDVAWALFQVDPDVSLGLTGPNSSNTTSFYPTGADGTPAGLSGSCNPSNLVGATLKGQACPRNPINDAIFFGRSGNGWSTIDCRRNGNGSLTKPANFYLAMWMNSPSVTAFPGSMNLVFKSRYGCGVLCVADSVGQSVTCNPNGGKTVCAEFTGVIGTFRIEDNSAVKATSYTVKFYNIDRVPLSGGFTATYSQLSDPSHYITFGTQNNSNDKIYADVCANYADPNACYSISLKPVDATCDDSATVSGCLTPPTCQLTATIAASSGLTLSSSALCTKYYNFVPSVANKSFAIGGTSNSAPVSVSYGSVITALSSSCYTFSNATGVFTMMNDCAGLVKFPVSYTNSDGCTCYDTICVDIAAICPGPFVLQGPTTSCRYQSGLVFTYPLPLNTSDLRYEWSILSGGASIVGSSVNVSSVTVNTTGAGTSFIVKLLVKNLVYNTDCGFDTINVRVNNVDAGTLVSDQVICAGQTPAALSPSGLVCTGTAAYQWQSASTCSGPWSNISTNSSYTPSSANGAYRLILTCTVDGVECKDTSNCSTVTVNQFSANTISASQTICHNGTPSCLTGSTVTTSCTSEGYKWIKSTTGCNGPWVQVCNTGQCSNFNAANKDYCPSALTATTYYKRVVSANCNGTKCYDTSNCVTITVIDPEAGNIGSAQTICKGSCATPLSGSAPSNPGGCTISYNWQSAATCSGPWTNLGASPTFCPTATTAYRRIVSVTCNSVTCYDTSNCVVITVIDPEAGNITGNQTICSGSCASQPSGNAPVNPGGCTIAYVWQYASTCSGPWTSFPNLPNPLCPTATTSYRRITSLTCNGVTCYDTSNCITVTVNQFSSNSLNNPPAICDGTDPDPITGTTVTSTCSFVGYTWLISTSGCNGPWTSMSGGASYDPPALNVTTYYRRVAEANCSGTSCFDTSNCVTLTVKPVPSCSISGDPTVCSGDTICFTSTVSLGGASHNWTVTPAGSVSAVIVGSNTGSTVCVVATGGSGTYSVQDEVTVDGCSNTCSHSVIVNYCGAFCTYTQGYYGSPNGKSCDGTTRYINPVELIKSELANVPGGTLTIGTHSSGNYVDFPASTLAERQTSAQVINSVMPGGRTPRTMPAGSCVITSNPSSCFSYPAYLTQQGRINNNFFSQLLALSLSANMNARILAGFHLESGYLVTQKRSGCSVDADPVPCSSDGSAVSSRLLDQSVINYLNACGHNTVQDLIDLANYIIAGQAPAGQFTGCTAAVPSLNAVHGMCGALNEIFDECRAFVGYFPCAKTCSNINVPCTPTSTPTWDRTNAGGIPTTQVDAFPNPYKDQVTFVIKSPVAGQGSLKVYNALGQLISTVFQGSVPAGKSKNIQFTAPVADGSLFYIYEQDGRKVTGKLIKQ